MAIDHVVDAAGSADDDVLPRLQNADVLLYVGAADAGVTENAHVVTQSQHNLRVACYERKLRRSGPLLFTPIAPISVHDPTIIPPPEMTVPFEFAEPVLW